MRSSKYFVENHLPTSECKNKNNRHFETQNSGITYVHVFSFGLGCWAVTFWEIAAHSLGRGYSLCFVYLWFWLFPALVLRAGFGF